MFKQPTTWLVAVCAIVLAITPARADMCSFPCPSGVPDSTNPLATDSLFIQPVSLSDNGSVVPARFAVEPTSGLVSNEWALGELIGALCPTLPLEAHTFPSSGDGEVLELPPLPGSAGLFMSAMLSVGSWHLLRSTRHVRLGSLPEWYHTGGPLQIGHAVAFDMDFGVFRPCRFEQPVGERHIIRSLRYENRPCRPALLFLEVRTSRAPPLLSS